ncbi:MULTISPECIES: alpha/beta hydrolase [unclassified Paraburkholderia]|uniref:alpha/beta hydrolase n=1 Tax=unclassified Paraburkholderia TaxID=2615204 RepID=UPI002AB23C8A|nr:MULTISPECIES: alpha/beta fold hydrolase [unclassified Paraburkholderia]
MAYALAAFLSHYLIFPLVVAACILFGGPRKSRAMTSMTEKFSSQDYSDLPEIRSFRARDQTTLAYRAYPPSGHSPSYGSIVLIHGSSADSRSLHVLAKAIANAGFAAYALDMRGHGESGQKGVTAYVGQLEDDIEDFLTCLPEDIPRGLVGFSSGGGFAMRIAGGRLQSRFDNYLLVSPFISHDAPSSRPRSGGWVTIGLPRIVGLTILNTLRIRALNRLPVLRFAIDDANTSGLTTQYSFNLATNFRALPSYRENVRKLKQPMRILAGENDECIVPDAYEALFSRAPIHVPITIIASASHIDMLVSSAPLQAITVNLQDMFAPAKIDTTPHSLNN